MHVLTRLEPWPVTVVKSGMEMHQQASKANATRRTTETAPGSPHFCLAALLLCLSLNAAAATSAQQEITAGDPDYAFLERQIHLGESDQAREQLNVIVEQIERAHHRYHEDLVTPLTLLGDADMLAEEYDAALDKFDRARHITRVSHGLFDARQVPVVYREAEAFKRLGDLVSAVQREEYAFEIMQREHDRTDPDLLPALHRLADVYLKTYNLLAARTLYQHALEIHEANITHLLPVAVPALKGIALSYQLERFPPFYIDHANDNRASGPTASLRGAGLEEQHTLFNNFPGRRTRTAADRRDPPTTTTSRYPGHH